jgi:hypothetical protein
MAEQIGGYGITAFGRSEYGNAKSDIEPRYSYSFPADEEHGVNPNTTVKFIIYSFSSFIDETKNAKIEISENDGATYLTAYENGVFHPYYAPSSRVRRADGQSLVFYFTKVIPFLPDAHVIFRVTTRDEFGQEATKTIPIYWE